MRKNYQFLNFLFFLLLKFVCRNMFVLNSIFYFLNFDLQKQKIKKMKTKKQNNKNYSLLLTISSFGETKRKRNKKRNCFFN